LESVHALLDLVRAGLESAGEDGTPPPELTGVEAVEKALRGLESRKWIPPFVRWGIARCYAMLGLIRSAEHDVNSALALFEQALALVSVRAMDLSERTLALVYGRTRTVQFIELGIYYQRLSACSGRVDSERMHKYYEDTLASMRRLTPDSYSLRGALLDQLGREEEAVECFRHAIAAAGEVPRESSRMIATCHLKLARWTAQSDPEESDSHYERAIELLKETADDDQRVRDNLIKLYEEYAESLRNHFHFEEASAMEEAARELRERSDSQDEAS